VQEIQKLGFDDREAQITAAAKYNILFGISATLLVNK
jgi:hypothetical protein